MGVGVKERQDFLFALAPFTLNLTLSILLSTSLLSHLQRFMFGVQVASLFPLMISAVALTLQHALKLCK